MNETPIAKPGVCMQDIHPPPVVSRPGKNQQSLSRHPSSLGCFLTELLTLHAWQVPESEVEKRGDGYVLKSDPSVRVHARAHKMSKSRGNVVNPDDVVWQFGADSLRLYEMFMGPLRDTKVGVWVWV